MLRMYNIVHLSESRRKLQDLERKLNAQTFGRIEGTEEECIYYGTILGHSQSITYDLFASLTEENLFDFTASAKEMITALNKKAIKIPYTDKDLKAFVKIDTKMPKLRKIIESLDGYSLNSSQISTIKNFYILANRMWRYLKEIVPNDKKSLLIKDKQMCELD